MNDIYNYLFLEEKLSSSGMPTAEQIKSVADAGVSVVINLAQTTSQGALPDEGPLVESLGMKYIQIPVDWNNPTQQDLEEFFSAMDEYKEEKKLVHCQANFRATGFVTMYRVLRLGWKKEDALQDLQKIWNPAKYPVWEKFIEEHLR